MVGPPVAHATTSGRPILRSLAPFKRPASAFIPSSPSDQRLSVPRS